MNAPWILSSEALLHGAMPVDALDRLDDGQELAAALEAEIALRTAAMVRDFELADPRDRWRHTGEPRPVPSAAPHPRALPHKPAASTIQAFWYVARRGDPDLLARWLADHPADAPELFNIWKNNQC
ncbi:hypothetical protein ACVWZK_005497 [Bradyrhizobium sp. GM0.4]